ncbi:MAG: hypothetical protein IJ866_00230 [Alphaproteobacteria bacterium]|nr:hypothetical protein [Alphaproteobacteria bacterium]
MEMVLTINKNRHCGGSFFEKTGIKKPPKQVVFKILVRAKYFGNFIALPRNSPLCRQNQKTTQTGGF